MNTTDYKEAHLQRVREAKEAYTSGKAAALARAKAIAAAGVRDLEAAMDAEVRLAFEAGVSKTRIRQEGLGTTNQQSLIDSLKRSEGLAAS